MMIIGLTGGIGSGKSAVGACFQAEGLPVIDADKIGHHILEQDAQARDAVIGAFGKDITADGIVVCREKLAARVFADPAARQQLNALLHPAIASEIGRRCATLHQQGHKAVIVEAALVGESGRRDPWLSGLILTLAAEKTRMERLTRQRGMSDKEAAQRIAAQTPPESKIPLADWIIHNDGTREALRLQVKEIADAIRARTNTEDGIHQ